MIGMHANSRELTVPGVCPNHRPPAVGRRLLAVKMPFAASGFQTFRALRVLRGSLLVLLRFAGCAGYQIGNQSLFPQEIHTVYVPVFKSNSFRRNLGERLTEAVVKEIEEKNAVQGRRRGPCRQHTLRRDHSGDEDEC